MDISIVLPKRILVEKAIQLGLRKQIAFKRTKKQLLKYINKCSQNQQKPLVLVSTAKEQETIQELSNEERVEITSQNFEKFTRLFNIPDCYYTSNNYQCVTRFIQSNYITDDVDNFSDCMQRAIVSYLSTLIEKEDEKLYVQYDAADIVLNGWENIILSNYCSICDFFLLYATRDTPNYTLPRRSDEDGKQYIY